jgi:integrase
MACPNAYTHRHQVLANFLTHTFSEIRDATGLFNRLPALERPSFHEVRALGSHLYERAGYDTKDVQELMAHTDEIMTKRYQAGFETRWTEINLRMPSAVIGREF